MTTKRLRTPVIAILVIACVGLGVYLAVNKQPGARPTAPAQPPAIEQPSSKVKVYQVSVEDNESKLRATENEIEPGEDPKIVALRRLLEQGDTADLANPIPDGARLLGLKVKDDLAIVDLSREFRDNFAGGSEDEALAIGAILRTLGQFSGIRRVEFLVEGKPLDTLGHLELLGPQDVDWVGSKYDNP